MTRKLVFRRIATQDVIIARDWYEGQRVGLGTELVDEVRAVAEKISSIPEMYEIVEPERSVRRALVRRFPYVIYFLIESRRILVIAVLHAARDPLAWHDRR